MRREPEFFGDQEMDLVFMARKLKHALAVEEALTKAGVDYAVEVGEYQGGLFSGIVFRSTPKGAYFYVLPDQREKARQLTREAGFAPYESA